MVASGVPNKGTATKVKGFSKVYGKGSSGDNYTQPGSNWRPSACQADVIAARPWVPAEAEARVAPMAGQAVRVVNVSVDKGLFSSVGRACAP